MSVPHLPTLLPRSTSRREEVGLQHRLDFVQAGGFMDPGVFPPALRNAEVAASLLHEDLLTVEIDHIPVLVQRPCQGEREDLVSRSRNLLQEKLVCFAEFKPLEIKLGDW